MNTAPEVKDCRECGGRFPVFEEDKTFYARLDVPAPRSCPTCRERRRLAYVNQLNLFRRNCSGTGKSILTMYPPTAPFPVHDQAHWYSDAVDNTSVGRDIDFARPFFEQYAELKCVAARPALFTDFARDENSEYTNFAGRNKNCYLIFDSDENWDCYYGYSMNGCRNTVECYRAEQLELCCEAVDSRRCYNCFNIQNCEACVDSAFLANCIGCKHCIGCSNLVQKEYYAFNKQISKDEYKELWNMLRTAEGQSLLRRRFDVLRSAFPMKYQVGFQTENSVGNYLTNSKNAFHCFDCRDLWDGRYCFQSFMPLKDCMDIDQCGEGELLYECNNLGYNAFNCRFSSMSLNQISNLTYCEICMNGCSDLFGCIGLKKKQYCILNKQYTKHEFEMLVPRIIEHMKRTAEWGEYLPPSCSTQAYNDTLAQLFYPLTKEQAIRQGFSWREEEQSAGGLPAEASACSGCGKAFKHIAQELELYHSQGWALPSRCFMCRHTARMHSRSPRELWQRRCSRCGIELLTAHPPGRPEPVCCAPCYAESLI